MDLEQRVKDFIVSNFYVSDPSELAADAMLIGRGIVDSTGMLEVIAFLENDFGIQVEDDEMLPENLGSIGRIAAFVGRKLQARGA